MIDPTRGSLNQKAKLMNNYNIKQENRVKYLISIENKPIKKDNHKSKFNNLN